MLVVEVQEGRDQLSIHLGGILARGSARYWRIVDGRVRLRREIFAATSVSISTNTTRQTRKTHEGHERLRISRTKG